VSLRFLRQKTKNTLRHKIARFRTLKLATTSLIKRVLFRVVSQFLKTRAVITNSNFQSDGLGAQAQRIVSIAAFAEHMGLTFKFKRIENIEVQHGDSYVDEAEVEFAIREFNDFFQIQKSQAKSTQASNYLEIRVESIFEIIKVLISIVVQNKKIAIALDSAYFYTNECPEIQLEIIQNRVSQISNIKIASTLRNFIDIQLHLRATTISQSSDRYIPTIYYVDTLRRITNFAITSKIKYTITIHTDIQPGKSDNPLVNKFLTQATLDYWKDIKLAGDSGESRAEIQELGSITLNSILEEFPVSKVLSGITPLQSWKTMFKCDFLITSKSSFSTLGGMFASNAVVITPPGFNPMRNTWFEWHESETQELELAMKRVRDRFLARKT
jgi:hypothetical protein